MNGKSITITVSNGWIIVMPEKDSGFEDQVKLVAKAMKFDDNMSSRKDDNEELIREDNVHVFSEFIDVLNFLSQKIIE